MSMDFSFNTVSEAVRRTALWKSAHRDLWSALTWGVVGCAFLLQLLTMGGILWSRLSFGSSFNPTLYSEFEAKNAETSIQETYKIETGELSLENTRAVEKDHVSRAIEQAGEEMENARLRWNENDLVRREAEKKAMVMIEQADVFAKNQSWDLAIEQLQRAIHMAPDFLPAIRKLALVYEERHDYPKARFQWEKAGGIALPQSAEMKEIQEHLDRLSTLAEVKRTPDTPVTSLRLEAPVAAQMNELKIKEVTMKQVPLEDLYDFRLNVSISLTSSGSEPMMDPNQTKIEVIFFDKSYTAKGTLVPIKMGGVVKAPEKAWETGTVLLLSVKYGAPAGYLRKKRLAYGDGYDFCGFITRVYYRGKLQDYYVQPKEVLENQVRLDLLSN
jgi:hypothetical protein